MRYNHSLRRLVFLFTKVSHSSISWVFHAFLMFGIITCLQNLHILITQNLQRPKKRYRHFFVKFLYRLYFCALSWRAANPWLLVFVLVEIEVFRAEWFWYILWTVLYMEAVVFHIGGGAVQLHKLVILLCARGKQRQFSVFVIWNKNIK